MNDTTKKHDHLSHRAMLAAIHIRCWDATRTDKKISREVAEKHDVKEKRAGKYRKYAIDIEAPSYKAVKTAAQDLRLRHYFWTLPWGEEGGRILPSKNHHLYTEDIRNYGDIYKAAVDSFVADFPALQRQAQIDLNGMYNAADYPGNIRAKFDFELKILPLPAADDFRAELPEDVIKEIKDGIEEEVARTTGLAMQDPYERLYEHIQRMVQRLSNPKGIFRDTLVTGLVELCQVLPGLNITDDPKLDELRQRAEAMIEGIDPQTLRDTPSVRRTVAKKAAEIENVMAAFMPKKEK